jgi:signal peptidase II
MRDPEKAEKNRYRIGALCGILSLTLLDQITKFLAISFLKNQSAISLIPGVLELSYLENQGMAFGLMQGKIVFLLLHCLFFFAVAGYCFFRLPAKRYYVRFWITLSFVTAGALGNFLDRLLHGYVVDFIYLSVIDFPVFNVADIFVTCGCVSMIFKVLFNYKDEDFSFLRPGK